MTEKQQTTINLIAKLFSYGTSLLISFFLTPFLVENIGKEAYSFYPIANNFVNYTSIITIALNSMASRYITITLTKNNYKETNEYFISILIANIVLSLLLVLPLATIILFLDRILDIPLALVCEVKQLFALIFASMFVNLLTNVFGVAVFAKNRLELGAACDITVTFVKVLLFIFLFSLFKPSLVFIGIVTLIVSIITICFQFLITKKLLPFIVYSINYFKIKCLKTIITSGVWNSINQIGTVLLSTIGLMLFNILYGVSAAGDYSVSLIIPQCINGIVSVISSVFLPGMTIKYAQGNKSDLIKHVNKAQFTLGVIVNIPVINFLAVGRNFYLLWMPELYNNSMYILSMLSTGYILVTSIMWPLSNLNIVMNKVKIPAITMVGVGVVNIILILLAKTINIGFYSIPITQLILFVLYKGIFICKYTSHCLNCSSLYFYRPLVKSLLTSVILFMISYIINIYINPISWMALIFECILLGVLGLMITFVVQKKDIHRFINE